MWAAAKELSRSVAKRGNAKKTSSWQPVLMEYRLAGFLIWRSKMSSRGCAQLTDSADAEVTLQLWHLHYSCTLARNSEDQFASLLMFLSREEDWWKSPKQWRWAAACFGARGREMHFCFRCEPRCWHSWKNKTNINCHNRCSSTCSFVQPEIGTLHATQ